MVCKYLIRQNSPTVSCSRNDYHLQFVCILLGFTVSFSVGLFLCSPFLSLSFPHWLLLSLSAPSLFSSLQSDSFSLFLLLEHTWDWGSKIWLFLSLSKFYSCVCVCVHGCAKSQHMYRGPRTTRNPFLLYPSLKLNHSCFCSTAYAVQAHFLRTFGLIPVSAPYIVVC